MTKILTNFISPRFEAFIWWKVSPIQNTKLDKRGTISLIWPTILSKARQSGSPTCSSCLTMPKADVLQRAWTFFW